MSLLDLALLTCDALCYELVREREEKVLLEELLVFQLSQSRKVSGLVSPGGLSDVVSELSSENEAEIFVVRRINKLIHPVSQLNEYFSNFGTVVKVLLLPWRKLKEKQRSRASSLGFILMGDSFTVQNILKEKTHLIDSCKVEVEKFHK
jgi:hypothetical protein